MEYKENSVAEAGEGIEPLISRASLFEALMRWELKAHPHPTLFMDMGFGLLTLFFMFFYLYGHFHENENTRELVTFSAPVPIAIILIFWIGIVRQKTFYSYRISETGGVVDYWLYFPKCAGWIFKGIAVFALVTVLAIISIMPMMIFALVGVGAITIPAALKLLAWENEIDSDSFEWDRVQLIVADRKRSLVVLQRRYHPDIPFEQNYMYFKVFLPRQRFDEFIRACKHYAPSTVDFEEGDAGY
ncbi:hypothetical protein [Pseudomonas quasicaspiana]|uniref:hypothetical protein n=1 Tax=Pseudomonas quasicaspiana TaxID=2829821 RepID=UPI001E55C839|nr:hypothetical protein [Pseudomonas quasicaspiana]MCD5979479.1 hypothetical protein [Pseudomonas quasicaspiana]